MSYKAAQRFAKCVQKGCHEGCAGSHNIKGLLCLCRVQASWDGRTSWIRTSWIELRAAARHAAWHAWEQLCAETTCSHARPRWSTHCLAADRTGHDDLPPWCCCRFQNEGMESCTVYAVMLSQG